MNFEAQSALAPGESDLGNLEQVPKPLTGLMILVVEDEWLIGEELKDQLEALGH